MAFRKDTVVARAEPIKRIRFKHSKVARLGVETLTYKDLQTRAPAEHFAKPERVEFYQLILFNCGRGVHHVDFVAHPVRAGSLVLVQPGQVQRYRFNSTLDARMVLVDPVFLLPETSTSIKELLFQPGLPVCLQVPSDLGAQIEAGADQIEAEVAAYQGDAATAALMQHLLYALLLRIRRFAGHADAAASASDKAHNVHRLFKQALEAAFLQTRSVRDYAQRLGYSEKTLLRACLTIEGQSAKNVIDQRVALEAKRLLAYSDLSVAELAHRLGFSEATNFLKFFRRLVDTTPLEFRNGIKAG